MKLEEIKKDILKGKTIEEILERIEWKEFENVVKEIFEVHEFKVMKNFRFKTDRKYEIDLVAKRNSLVLCIDCKKWRGGRYKTSDLKKAIKEQEKRTEEFKKFLKNSFFDEKPKIKPLIVTLLEEDILRKNKTWVVPIGKLNSFLLELEKYF